MRQVESLINCVLILCIVQRRFWHTACTVSPCTSISTSAFPLIVFRFRTKGLVQQFSFGAFPSTCTHSLSIIYTHSCELRLSSFFYCSSFPQFCFWFIWSLHISTSYKHTRDAQCPAQDDARSSQRSCKRSGIVSTTGCCVLNATAHVA